MIRDSATLLEAGRLAEAEAVALRAVAEQPPSTAARSVLGAILEQRGKAKEAEAEFREALRLDANSTVALTNLGGLLVHAGRVDEAVTTFERVLRLAPGHTGHANLRASACVRIMLVTFARARGGVGGESTRTNDIAVC